MYIKNLITICILAFIAVIASQAVGRLNPVDLLKEKLQEKQCYTNEDLFVACGFALNELFLLTQKTTALPESYSWSAEKKFQNLDIQSTFVKNGISFSKIKVELKPEYANSSEIVRLPRSIFENSVESWKSLFQKTKNNSSLFVPFKDFVLDATAKMKDANELESVSISVLSKYISTIKRDPHAYFKSTADLFAGLSESGQKYTGVGVTLNAGAVGAEVVGVIEGTSAEELGVQEGDVITQVENTTWQDLGQNLRNFTDRIRGDANTLVKVKILREGKTLDFTLMRKTVDIVYNKVKYIDYQSQKYGLIRIESFTSMSGCLSLRTQIADLVKTNGFPAGWILDLRGNPGGLVFQAQCVAGLFLNKNQSVYYRLPTNPEKDGQNYLALVSVGEVLGAMFGGDPAMKASIEKEATKQYIDSILPLQQSLVVLVDEGSASASELVAGALRDQKRAIIVGEQTYGKGCGQEIDPDDSLYSSYGLTLFSTSFYYLKPNGGAVQHFGIYPDIEVPSSIKAQENPRPIFKEENLAPSSLPPLAFGKTPRISRMKSISRCSTNFDWQTVKDIQMKTALRAFSCGW